LRIVRVLLFSSSHIHISRIAAWFQDDLNFVWGRGGGH